MSTLRMIGMAIIGICVGTQVILLALQADALRRYKHKSFLLIVASTLCFLVYAVIAATPSFVALSRPTLINIYASALVFLAVGAVLGVWGVWYLFRQYGRLLRASIGSDLRGPNNSSKRTR